MVLAVSEDEVDAIVAEEDRTLRNLQITVAYSRMAEDFARRVDDQNLSWCAFGTWASEGVGAAIRHHQTDRSWFLRLLRWVCRRRYAEIAGRAETAFACGNRSVFDHIGRGFATFHEALDSSAPDAMARFFAGLQPPEEAGEVDLVLDRPVGLADGFGHYAAVLGETDPVRRAQLVAAGNLCLAYVEQLRLQAPIVDAFGAVLPRWLAWRRPAQVVASWIVTEAVLRIDVDDESFRPRRPLPRLDGRRYPRDLVELDPELFAPFQAVVADASRRKLPECDNWRSLRGRLRYIGALMRSRQQRTSLLGRVPFPPPLVDQIVRGVIPEELTAKVLA